MKTYKFYDTQALLKCRHELFKSPNEIVVFSDITMYQIINQKYSEDGTAAFELHNILKDHEYEYVVWKYFPHFFQVFKQHAPMLQEAPIFAMLACAIDYDTNEHPDETVFVTTDKVVGDLANRVCFGEDSVIYV